MGHAEDPKARLDQALAKQRRLQKEVSRQRRDRGGEPSVVRTFVAWARGAGAPQSDIEDSGVTVPEGMDADEPSGTDHAQQQQQQQQQQQPEPKPGPRQQPRRGGKGVFVAIAVLLGLIVALLVVVAVKLAR